MCGSDGRLPLRESVRVARGRHPSFRLQIRKRRKSKVPELLLSGGLMFAATTFDAGFCDPVQGSSGLVSRERIVISSCVFCTTGK